MRKFTRDLSLYHNRYFITAKSLIPGKLIILINKPRIAYKATL